MSAAIEARIEIESPKRQAVIDGAATLFMAQGYGAVSMDAIAREAGVSKATLYAHFTSKDQLFATIIGEACRSKIAAADVLVQADIETSSDIGDALRAFGVRMMRFLMEPTTQAIYRVVVAECVRFPELGQAFYEAGPANFLRFFSDWIGAQMQAGRLRDADPAVAAEQFNAMIRGGPFIRASVGLPSKHDDATIERHVGNVVDTFLRAYRADQRA
jgi:TetR/AcrR family transcriptional regulator, mexJK operon transcriptional repressor